MEPGPEAVAGAILPYLHLARRGANLVLGYRAVKQGLGAGRISLLIMAQDAGASLRRLETGKTPLLELADRQTLGEWLGRQELAILGVTDSQLAAGMLAKVAELRQEPDPA